MAPKNELPEPELAALVRLDRPVAPTPEADARIREILDAAIEEDLTETVRPIAVDRQPSNVVTLIDVSDQDPGPATTNAVVRSRRFPHLVTIVPTMLGVAAACLVVALLLNARPSNDDPSIITANTPPNAISTAVCGPPFERFAAVWERTTAGGAVLNNTLFSPSELAVVVGAQHDWVTQLEAATAAAPSELSPAGAELLKFARSHITESQGLLQGGASSAQSGAQVTNEIGQTQRNLLEIMEQHPSAFGGCTAQRITWPG